MVRQSIVCSGGVSMVSISLVFFRPSGWSVGYAAVAADLWMQMALSGATKEANHSIVISGWLE